MKQKINLTLDSNLIIRTKRYARKHGISVSRLIEMLLSDSVTDETGSFSAKWQGKFKLAEKDEPRMAKLKERYL